MKPRHVPLRTCAGCRQQHPKREMVRVVHTSDGSVRTDPSGKLAGRGAYVCPRADCWQAALRTGSLGRVLKTTISQPDGAELQRVAATYRDGEPLAEETVAR